MRNYSNQIISIILLFFVTLFLNVGIEQLFKNNGTIETSTIRLPGGSAGTHIRIENYSKKPIDNLKILVPVSAALSEATSSSPVQIANGKSSLSSKEVKLAILSLIPPKTTTEIIIPTGKTNGCCVIVNAEALRLTDTSDTKPTDPLMESLYRGIQTALIYSFFFAIVVFYQKSQVNDLRDKLDKFEEKHGTFAENSKKRLEEVQSDANEIRSSYGRMKAILIRRVADYSKELEFWRNTIRKVLYERLSDKSEAESLISMITTKLETYGTRARHADEMETIESLARNISEYNIQSDNADRLTRTTGRGSSTGSD
jgi:hypothetical protein